MDSNKYNLQNPAISSVLTWIREGDIAIPEIQRPFVWDSSKVRDLMDSLYQGFPIGYIITWKNPNVKLKDGSNSEGKKVLIDGQQRITALTAAVAGQMVVTKNYEKKRINIAFHPSKETFEVLTPVIAKDPEWIPDISEALSQGGSYSFITGYFEKNPDVDKDKVSKNLDRLFNLSQKQIGLIELSGDLSIDAVTEIFIRINNQGVTLTQADFAMSKIAADAKYGGPELRKAIDYFCHLAVAPEDYHAITEGDKEFARTSYHNSVAWLKDEREDMYDPSFSDLLRVAFVGEFMRGKFSDLVSLLSGRNFETRGFEESIAEDTFTRLKKSVLEAMNETHFKRFLMIIRSSGFITKKMLGSSINVINFSYILYLSLKREGVNDALIEKYVRRWFVLSKLTGRYSTSVESTFDRDIKIIESRDFGEFLDTEERSALSDAFWDVTLPERFDTHGAGRGALFQAFLAAQVKGGDMGFLSTDITVESMLQLRGDIHHLFPKNHLMKLGMKRNMYNQLANYVYMQQEVNIKVSDSPLQDYMARVLDQCNGGELTLGGINSIDKLKENLRQNAIPEQILEMTSEDYPQFLKLRRKLMAQKIKEYYFNL